MKVNMTPNPLDVVTIHASQGDTEARQWEFELHNNGELIDTSDVKEQLVFKAYKGGTEQLLPENGSTPTTSPFLGDIRYPQGLLTDQEFLYRQSPTEEDGLAKITDIKGNTIVWNQIFIPYDRTGSGIQTNVIQDVNDYSVRIYGTSTANAWLRMDATGTLPVGHKFLLDKGSTSDLFDINNNNNGLNVDFSAKSKIGTVTTADTYIYIYVKWGTTIDVTVKPILIDLTAMFGAGNEPTTVEEFTSLFSLPYYDYNQGTLLSFMGNGIKTVGVNILDLSSEFDRVGVRYTVDEDGWFTVTHLVYPSLYNNRFMLPLALTNGSALIEIDTSKTVSTNFRMILYNDTIRVATTTTKLENKAFDRISFDWSTPGSTTFRVMVTTMPTIGTYEPYTSSTLSLPISTYFPTGMKSAGTVYDELTPNKAITRIGAVDLGTLNWVHRTEVAEHIFSCDVTNSVLYKRQLPVNFEIAKYNNGGTVIGVTDMIDKDDKTLCVYFTTNTGSRYIYIKDSSFSDATALKNSLNGIYLYFELDTYTETEIITASLVTENGEVALANENGVLVGKCNSDISADAGFIEGKIKLSDGDGDVYSNKIQIHVERSPQ